ncbi:MAG: hypothetical protein HQL74_12180 [Magnetococcales bacterium]|nr:hypothetical protein [Magnetococcales bacterium]
MAKPRGKKSPQGKSSGRIQAAVATPVYIKEEDDALEQEKKRPAKKKSTTLSLWINLISYSFFFWTLRMIGKALPEETTFFTRMFELEVHPTWNMELVNKSTNWLLAIAGVSILHMGIGVARNRGRFRANEIAALILSGISFALAMWLMRLT